MNTTRRNIVRGSLISLLYYFLNIKSVSACIGDGPYITKIKESHLRNVQFIGHRKYLKHYYPHGYKYSEDIVIRGFTDKSKRKSINVITGKVSNGETYTLEGSTLQIDISLININNGSRCTNIRIIFQDKTNNGPCFEVANYHLGEHTLPSVVLRIKPLSGQNPSFFIVAEVNSRKNNNILVSNVYPFKSNCDGATYLEIIHA